MGVGDEKAAVQFATLLFQHSDDHLGAGLAEDGCALPVDFREGVKRTDNHTPESSLFEQEGTGRGAPEVGTGFKADVDGELAAVDAGMFGIEHGHGVDLGMGLSAAAMKALGKDLSIATYNHGSDKGVGMGVWRTAPRNLDDATHVVFVWLGCHGAKVRIEGVAIFSAAERSCSGVMALMRSIKADDGLRLP